MTYTMHIEKPIGTVTQHGFHLGTDEKIAESFVIERLKSDRDIVSIALRNDGQLVRFYDWRDLESQQTRTQGTVWIVTAIETTARQYGPIVRVFARQRDAEAYARMMMTQRNPGCDDIVYDCSAFTLYG